MGTKAITAAAKASPRSELRATLGCMNLKTLGEVDRLEGCIENMREVGSKPLGCWFDSLEELKGCLIIKCYDISADDVQPFNLRQRLPWHVQMTKEISVSYDRLAL